MFWAGPPPDEIVFKGKNRLPAQGPGSSWPGYNPAPASTDATVRKQMQERWKAFMEAAAQQTEGGGQTASTQPTGLQQAPPQRPTNRPAGPHQGPYTMGAPGGPQMSYDPASGKYVMTTPQAGTLQYQGTPQPQGPPPVKPQMYQGPTPATKPPPQQPQQMPAPEMSPYGGMGSLGRIQKQPQQAQNSGAWGAGGNLYGNAWGG